MDRFGALTAAALALTAAALAVTAAALAVTAVFATGRGFAAGRRAGLATLSPARFRAVAAGRLRRTGRLAPRGCPELRRSARGAGFRAFLADFAATRRLGAFRFRLADFFDAARLRPAAFRAPVFFLPACPGRRRRARVAFRLAMGRPFRSIPGPFLTLTVTGKLRILYVLSATNNRSQSAFRGLLVTPRIPSRRAQARRNAGRLISAHVYERTRSVTVNRRYSRGGPVPASL